MSICFSVYSGVLWLLPNRSFYYNSLSIHYIFLYIFLGPGMNEYKGVSFQSLW